jgi:hypothetical protein
VAGAPPTLTVTVNRDRNRWWQSPWIRRVLLLVPLALALLGLANFFGQRPVSDASAAPAARLAVKAPVRARSGLIYAARFEIDAARELKDATLLLDQGWADGYTVNGQAPQPLTQGSADGRIVYGFGHVPAGKRLTFWLSLQVNPTTVGHRRQDVSLYDGDQLVTTVHRTLTIFP